MRRYKPKTKISFEDLAREANKFLMQDGIPLNFSGYKDSMIRYFSIIEHDIVDIFENLTNCNLWSNYFSETEAVLNCSLERYSLSVDYYLAIEDKNNPSTELEDLLQEEKRKLQIIKQLKKQVRNQKRFFEKAANHCLFLYKKATKSFSTYGNK